MTSWVDARKERLISLLGDIDNVEIEQFAQYSGCCDICNSPFYGILDESKLILPIGGVADRLVSFHGITVHVNHNGLLLPATKGEGYLSQYEIRQDLVRSGIFTRDQLSKSGIFTEHELEVNDQSFLNIRPRRCDCNFGSEPELNDEELAILAMCEHDEQFGFETEVDKNFLSGKPVRTGFRRRSRAKISERRQKRKCSKTTTIFRIGRNSSGIKPDDFIELKFKFIVPRKRDWKVSRTKRYIYKPGTLSRNRIPLPKKEKLPDSYIRKHPKYCYFRRKRGVAYASEHHPLGDEPNL